MTALGVHMEKHLKVHLVWLIIVLSLCTVALIVYQPDADKVNAFISFAATLSSLFLAIVAIFYSMVANQGFSSTLGFLQSSSANVESAARNISETSAALSGQSEKLISELVLLNPTVMGIAEKIDRLSPSANSEVAQKITSAGSSLKSRNVGTTISLYLLVRSFEEKKPIVTGLVFPDRLTWDNYASGFLEAIYLLSPLGIEIERGKQLAPERDYVIKSLGSLDPDSVKKATTTSKEDTVINLKPVVDAYFEKTDQQIDVPRST